jgi:crotonobetainyl-CoA:carnitine CoA-transferase CaiB-like acyl-CoA transferase
MSNNILKGIRVIELGTHVAIPYCARELADMGADVIKIEPPQGEAYRSRMGMLFHLPFKPDHNVIFTPYNVNKKSLSLNLKDADGKEAFLKLLGTADIFITNTREMALERLGLSFDFLKEKFPKLIIGNVNGFGTKGTDKDRGGYDATSFWSPSGALLEWGTQGSKVFKPFYGFGDSIAAAQLTAGIMSALYQRERSGKGEVVRVSLLAAGLWHNICGLLRYQVGHNFPKSYYDPILPLDNFYLTKDGKWLLCSEERWDVRCKAYFELFGTPELIDDPEWNSMKGYISNISEKVKYFEEHIAQVTSEQITEVLSKVDAVFEFLHETKDVVTNEQAWANDFLREMKTASGQPLTISNIPIEFESQDFIDEITPAPQLGENSAEILSGLGYTEEQIKAMVDKGAVVLYSNPNTAIN